MPQDETAPATPTDASAEAAQPIASGQPAQADQPIQTDHADQIVPSAQPVAAAPTHYLLKPRPPVRAFLIAALLALVGAVLLVVSLASSWHLAVTITAGVVLGLGVVLLVLALLSVRTLAMRVTFDADGYRVTGPDHDVSGTWADVTKVVQLNEGGRLVFHHGEVRRTHLWCPAGVADPQFQALVGDVAKRLDASRGYSQFV